MANPLVSILIPAYNCEAFVVEAVQSALDQSYTNKEIIVVNDGSTDSTARALERFNVDGIKLITQTNQGQCAAANRAFEESRGAYIKFLDADDVLAPDTIEAQVATLDGSATHVASCRWGRFYGNDPLEAKFKEEPNWKDMQPVDWLCTAFSEGASMMQCGIWLIPRAVLNAAGLWNVELSLINDFDFFFRILLASEGIRFSEGGALYYRSGVTGSLSNTFSEEAAKSAFSSLSLGTAALLTAEDSKRTRQVCADVFKRWAFSFYPEHPDLAKAAEVKSTDFGGSKEKLPAGTTISAVSALFGWRFALKLRGALYQLGWKKVAQAKAKQRYESISSS